MKTGLESLDTGAPEITYSGNQGPKSPQEDQQKMAEFELQEYMEEFERVFPDMKDERGTPDYMKELQDYFEGLASKQEEGVGSMAMKSGLIDEYRNYKMGQEEAGEQFMSPRDYYRSLEQDRMGVKEGGSMDFAMQGGVKNYLGEQEIVSGVPVKWQSGPGKPDTELAYITKAEKDLLLKEDIHGSLQDGPNMGPGGIMSLDSFGDIGGAGASGGDTDAGGGYDTGPGGGGFTGRNTNTTTEREFDRQKANQRAALQIAERAQAKDLGYKERENIATMDRPGALENKLGFNVLDFIPGIGMARRLASMFGPLDNKAFFTEKVLTSKNPQGYTEDDYEDYMAARMAGTIDAYGNLIGGNIGGGGGEGPRPMGLAIPMTTSDMTTEDPEELGTDFTFNFGQPNRSLTEADQARISNIGGKSIFLADGGRANYADGGITDLRQGYFLGKLVKKAVRGIKKVAKSPIGKLALMYGGAKLGGMGLGKFNRAFPSFFSEGMGKTITDRLFRLKTDDGYKGLDPFKIGIGALSALTYLKGKQDEDDEPSLDEYMKTASRGPSMDPRGIRDYIAANKGRVDPNQYAFLQPNFYAADGGRIDYANGGIGELRGALSKEMFGYDDDEDDVKKLAMGGSTGLPPVTMQLEGTDSMSFPDDESTGMPQATPTATLPNQMPRPRPIMDSKIMQQMMMASKMNPQMGGRMNSMMGNRMMAAMGGRMGFADGGANYSFGFKPGKEFQLNVNSMGKGTIKEIINSGELTSEDLKAAMDALRNRKAEGGMMDMGGLEKDYRNDGGFVPIGGQERADDVPARLSKNEFVFTADAVRNAGGGDIDKGAEIMENMMENLENGGKVSQGSQGLDGAREMFATQQRLGEVL